MFVFGIRSEWASSGSQRVDPDPVRDPSGHCAITFWGAQMCPFVWVNPQDDDGEDDNDNNDDDDDDDGEDDDCDCHNIKASLSLIYRAETEPSAPGALHTRAGRRRLAHGPGGSASPGWGHSLHRSLPSFCLQGLGRAECDLLDTSFEALPTYRPTN